MTPDEPDGSDRGGRNMVARSVAAIVLAGALYLAVGLVFGTVARSAASLPGVRAWRLAAWAVCALVFAAHIIYVRVMLRRSSPATALDAAIGVALGALGLAVAAFVHGMATHHRFPLFALAVWPVMLAIPAFLVALVMAVLVDRASERR
jgi:hypothetical protein